MVGIINLKWIIFIWFLNENITDILEVLEPVKAKVGAMMTKPVFNLWKAKFTHRNLSLWKMGYPLNGHII